MNDLDISVLSSRLDRLADDLTPQLDVVDQVRRARARHRRARTGRIAVLATVAATVLVVGVPTAVSVLTSASATHGQVADPGITAPATTSSADQSAADQSTAEERLKAAEAAAESAAASTSEAAGPSAVMPAGWEPRSFLGITFAVPPGARMTDYVEPNPPAQSDGGPTFIWGGPQLGPDAWAMVKVQVGLTPRPLPTQEAGYEPISVQGALEALMHSQIEHYSNPSKPDQPWTDATDVAVEINSADRHVHLELRFAPDAAGEQMARDVIASMVVN